MKRSRRRLLKTIGAAGVGGGAVYVGLEGVPASVGGVGDPMSQRYPMSRVFKEVEWHDSGRLDVTINGGRDILGVSITEEGADPVYGSIDAADIPRNGGTGSVDLYEVIGRLEAVEMHALGGDVEDLLDPEIVSTETVDVPDL